MSSPAGAASGATGGDAAGNGQGEGDAGQQSGPDLSALAETVGGTNESVEQMRQILLSEPWRQQEQQQEQEEPGAEPLDLSFLDDVTGDQEAATQLADVIERQWQQREAALQQRFDQRLAQQDERLNEREQIEHMRDLVGEFPDMADPKIATAIVQQANELASANGWPEQMASDPRFWRITYLAQQAIDAAQEEGSEQPSAAHLEGGAGATGAQAQQRGDDFRQMLDEASQGGASVLPYP